MGMAGPESAPSAVGLRWTLRELLGPAGSGAMDYLPL